MVEEGRQMSAVGFYGDLKAQENIKEILWREFDFIATFLRDEETIEIMLNPDGKVWIEKVGSVAMECIGEMPYHHSSSLFAVIAHSMNKVIHTKHPWLEGNLILNNARFVGFYSPAASNPTFVIRKKFNKVFTLSQFQVSDTQIQLLTDWIIEHKNILVIGGTSSGKTAFANILVDYMATLTPDDRVIILEILDEIVCHSKNHVKLMGTIDIKMQQLILAGMRYRPDRLIVGEMIDDAALAIVKAWSTSHSGGLCTVHAANSAVEGLDRLYDLIAESGIKMSNRINRLISSAVDGVVFLRREGVNRIVKEVAEVKGFDGANFILNYIK